MVTFEFGALELNHSFLYQIEISRVYGQSEWRDDIRRMLMKAGIVGKPLAFLLADNQIMYEGMVEDVNMLLNTGDIPNLYGMDEKVEILDKMQAAVRESVSSGIIGVKFILEIL